MPLSLPGSRRLALPKRVASPVSTAVELRIFADSIGSDATGAAGEWLGIDPRLLHDLQPGRPSCMQHAVHVWGTW